MFDVNSDERMNAIQHRAGYVAFLSYFVLAFILLVLMASIGEGPLHDPYVVLLVPWLASMLIFLSLHIGKGFFRTIREEANRSPTRTLETRIRLLLSTFLFAVTVFLLKHLDLFDHDHGTLGTDILESVGMAVCFFVLFWFTQARTVRERDE